MWGYMISIHLVAGNADFDHLKKIVSITAAVQIYHFLFSTLIPQRQAGILKPGEGNSVPPHVQFSSVTDSCLTLQSHGLQPARVLCPWNSSSQSKAALIYSWNSSSILKYPLNLINVLGPDALNYSNILLLTKVYPLILTFISGSCLQQLLQHQFFFYGDLFFSLLIYSFVGNFL